MRTRSRIVRAVVTASITLVAALALVAPGGAAQAAGAGSWGSFTLAGSARAYTGSMTLPGGFPHTTFTSTSRQATVVGGASAWQAASTPAGAVYGSSRGRPYLNQRPLADAPGSPAITTYTFATPTPTSGWSFVLGDIDADSATITATDANGAAVDVSRLGFAGVYNYCHGAGSPSCDATNTNDVPTWSTPTPTTGVLTGNAASADTEGATGWFSPTVALKTLTIAFAQRSGLPVYQTWFATRTQSASGTVTVDGRPYGGSTVTVTDASGATVATTTSAADGTWSIPALVSADGYRLSVETPPGAAPRPPLPFDTLDVDTPGLDVDFSVAPITVTTTITDADGAPAADAPVVITREGDASPAVTTTTAADGSLTAQLLPEQTYVAIVDGATDQPITFTTGAISGAIAPLVQPAPPATTTPPSGAVPPTGTAPGPSTGPTTDPAVATDGRPQLAMTGSQEAGPAVVGGIVLLGAGVGMLLWARRRRLGRRSA